jgi:hypothetical protein
MDSNEFRKLQEKRRELYPVYHRICPLIRNNPNSVYQASSCEEALRALDLTQTVLDSLCDYGFLHYWTYSPTFCTVINSTRPFCIQLGAEDALIFPCFSDAGPSAVF